MKKLLVTAATAAGLFATQAVAAPTINVSFGGASGAFSNPTVFCGASGSVANTLGDGAGTSSWSTSGGTAPCDFTDTMTFVAPVGYALVGGSITTNTVLGGNGTVDDINFTSVTINGVEFNIVAGLVNTPVELRNITNAPLVLNPGLNTLIVKGKTYGTGLKVGSVTEAGAYAGGLTFAPPVPEPATWLSMIAGFGMLGFALRRTRQQGRVNFNFG